MQASEQPDIARPVHQQLFFRNRLPDDDDAALSVVLDGGRGLPGRNHLRVTNQEDQQRIHRTRSHPSQRKRGHRVARNVHDPDCSVPLRWPPAQA
jgi:hypothetical protein